MRNLATIRTIADISPIPGADKIEKCRIDGWEVVISKADNFKVGDSVVYIEIDSKMPELPQYEFLASRKYIVKTIKLRGQVSQGLVLPLAVLPEGVYNVGDDVTDILGIVKYDPEAEKEEAIVKQNRKNTKNPIIRYLLRFKWFRKIYLKPKISEQFPSWIKKSDEERIQNMPDLFKKLRDEKITLMVTEKVDGTSATYYLKKVGRKYEFGVCSRRRRLVTEDDSYYWNVARKFRIKDALGEIIGGCDWVVLQGEITGDKIQGNKYPAKGGERFWVFNLIFPEEKYDTVEIQEIIGEHGMYTVPIVEHDYTIPENGEIADIVEYVQGESQIYPREREGCVFRNKKYNVSFKCISPTFLIKNDA